MLFESGNTEELEGTQALLESRGIPVFVSGTESYTVRPLLGAPKKGLWVCIDDQYDDALALLKDENHRVAIQVDPVEFHRELQQMQSEPVTMLLGSGEAFLNRIAIAAVLIIGAWVAWAIFSA